MKKLITILLLAILIIGYTNKTYAWWTNLDNLGAPTSSYYLGDTLDYIFYFKVNQNTSNMTVSYGLGLEDNGTNWNWYEASWDSYDGTNNTWKSNTDEHAFTAIGNWYYSGRFVWTADGYTEYASAGWEENRTSLTATSYFKVNALENTSDNTATTVSNSEIDLSWTKWNSKDVLIVRKESAQSWTEPTQGTEYFVGNSIGDGVVIYNGSETSFESTGLNTNTTYDYKIYSINNNYYSSGEVVSATTQQATTWDGSSSKVWDLADNWSDGIPDGSVTAIIPSSLSNYPTISGAVTVGSIVLEDGATLVGQENLTVNGTATVEKDFIAYSSTTGDDGWYAISSPVDGMVIAGSDFVPGANDDLYEYSESSNQWLNYSGGTFGDANFVSGKGYLVSYASATTNSFKADDFNKTNDIAAPVSEANTRWNLIGNPYPSKVTWADVNITDVSSPKVLNLATGAWDEMGAEMEVAQGIFVYAEDEAGTPSVEFDLEDQTHGSAAKSTIAYANLKANYGDYDVTIRFATNDEASQEYEWQYDSRYMYPMSQIPYFSAITNDDVMVSTFVMDSEEEAVIVPLFMQVQEEQEINISFTGDFGYDVTLEDVENSAMIDLAEENFIYTATPEDETDRFVLHLAKSATTIDNVEELETVNVYAYANQIYINSLTDLTNATVAVYNTMGQVVATQQVHTGFETIEVSTMGAYIVKVQAEEGVTTQKVIIK